MDLEMPSGPEEIVDLVSVADGNSPRRTKLPVEKNSTPANNTDEPVDSRRLLTSRGEMETPQRAMQLWRRPGRSQASVLRRITCVSWIRANRLWARLHPALGEDPNCIRCALKVPVRDFRHHGLSRQPYARGRSAQRSPTAAQDGDMEAARESIRRDTPSKLGVGSRSDEWRSSIARVAARLQLVVLPVWLLRPSRFLANRVAQPN